MSKSSDNEDVTETQSCTFTRNLIFGTLYKEDPQVRATVLKSIGTIVNEWTQYFLRHTRDASVGQPTNEAPQLLHDVARPLPHLESSNGSDGTFVRSLKREPSSKLGLEFDDVFEVDNDSDPQIIPATTSSIDVPLTPTYESGSSEGPNERDGTIPPTFTLSYNKFVLSIFEGILGPDDRMRLEDLKDEVLTVHEMKKNLENYYLTLLRLSIDCPHKEVRVNSRKILKKVASSGMEIPEPVNPGPSRLISLQEMVGLNPVNTITKTDSMGNGLPSSQIAEMQEHSEDEDEAPISPINDNPISRTMSITIPGRSVHAFNGRSRSRGKGMSGSMSYRGNRRYDRSFGFGSNSDRGTPLSPPGNDLFNQPPRDQRRRRKQSTSQGSPQSSTSKLAPPEVYNFHKTAWMTNGRVTNMNRILSFYPTFAKSNLDTIEALISRPGSALSRTWRLYIGILAAAEHKCQYYVSLLSRYFLDYGGNKTWLRGLEYAPKKLQRLAKLNTLLAHQPWRLVHGDVQELIKGSSVGSGAEVSEPSDNWSTSEVVLAMCILSYFHAQSGFALACGLVPEVDLPGGTVGTIKKSALPIAPYILHVPSKVSKEVTSEDASGEMKRLDLPRTPSPGISLLTRKRQQLSMTENEEVIARSPDKWLKTPTGSVPASVDASPITQTFRNLRSLKLQKRRKSFEDCVTAEDTPPAALAISLSAPGSYIPMPNISQYPLGRGREFFLSPSSSSSSLVEASAKSLNEQVPVNVFADDNNRFLQSPLKTGIAGVNDSGHHEEFNLNSEEYSFLPMEDFDWERHACEVIGEYVEGLEDVLDNHFQQVQKIHDEVFDDDGLQPPSGRAPQVENIPSGIQATEFSIFDRDTPSHLHQGESFYSSNSQMISPGESFYSATESPANPMKDTTSVDIKPLKEAVWFYSLRLLGIQKDDYTYSDIKVYLRKGARVFLRRICEQPELVSVRDWKNIGMGLRSEDVVLMALLATQARFMGELLYGIKAVCEYRESRY